MDGHQWPVPEEANTAQQKKEPKASNHARKKCKWVRDVDTRSDCAETQETGGSFVSSTHVRKLQKRYKDSPWHQEPLKNQVMWDAAKVGSHAKLENSVAQSSLAPKPKQIKREFGSTAERGCGAQAVEFHKAWEARG